MRKLLVHLAVALLTFTVGVCASALWAGRRAQVVVVIYPPPVSRAASGPTACTLSIPETPEEKAVRLAVEFVTHNGYTSLPPHRDELSYESVETADSIESMLLDRFDTLEPRAYGFTFGQHGQSGYTVVFRYTNRMGDYAEKVGRAVTMDADFHNLRVEHKDCFLTKVHKRLQ